ncbi:hypothetical protein INP51_14915 [Blautia liquoris]|uniref:Uncharacterized protein n=1 Tax=Blautia liquoris TaxID=2779518 RepID=A0A7M2RGF1_9FIRM|nr:DUF6365 family protein [Blautia liquoris]QOV19218.1 hypothetical protein INP51_14915 [Blautia liquoris]
MNRTKIMVWTLGTISAGEISIAVRFTQGLSDELFDVLYLLPKNYQDVIPEKTKRFTLNPEDSKIENKQKIQSIVDEFSPDFFFLSDPYTAHFASSWTGYSFSNIQEFKIPIIGLDEYDLKEFKRKKDYYGGMLVNDRDLIEECDYLLQDVPVNPMNDYVDNKVWRYSLFSSEDINISQKEKIRKSVNEELEIDEDAKLIMLPVSSWESVNMNRLPILDGFIENLLNLVLFYLDELKLNEMVCLLHVGKQKINYKPTGNVTYKNISSMNSDLYEKCIVSSDIFMSFNAVSVSLSRAILNQVPSILMINEKVLNFALLEDTIKKLPAQYGEIVKRIHIAYPYYASTFGWYKFIRSITQNNDYYDLFTTVPVFSYSKMKAAISEALDSNQYYKTKTEKLNTYLNHLLELDSPNEIMIQICDKKGV